MPHVYLAKNYMRVKAAKEAGFTTCSLQGSSRSGECKLNCVKLQ